MVEGKALIKYFCVPYDTTDGVPKFHSPSDAPDKWDVFKAYNKRDVETELAIDHKISRFPVPDFLWEEYILDQEINDRGIRIDVDMVNNAINIDAQVKEKMTAEMKRLTGLDNPNSVQQMREWLSQNGIETEALGKKDVQALLQTVSPEIQNVLRLRLRTAKSSVKKYTAMQTAVCSDGRARGMFQFYGGNRTGREAGRIIQLQNCPQNHISDLAEARELVKSNNFNALEMLYDDVPDTLSQLIRTALVPRDGYKFIVCDYNAIELRIAAWLSGEQWVTDAFASGGDIYCVTASKMFGVPVEKHGINSDLRQKGKQATLSCSYGGSVGALKAMGAVENGMKEEDLLPLVKSWREANPHIVKSWLDIDHCAKQAIKGKTTVKLGLLTFEYESGFLFITLPSGRKLAYVRPKIAANNFGSESITYEGVGTNKHWERLESYGAKIYENCIQGIARDILFHSLKILSHCFIVATVHDEIIIEADKRMSVEAVCEQMARTPAWADGLLLRADGYECDFYKKD